MLFLLELYIFILNFLLSKKMAFGECLLENKEWKIEKKMTCSDHFSKRAQHDSNMRPLVS